MKDGVWGLVRVTRRSNETRFLSVRSSAYIAVAPLMYYVTAMPYYCYCSTLLLLACCASLLAPSATATGAFLLRNLQGGEAVFPCGKPNLEESMRNPDRR